MNDSCGFLDLESHYVVMLPCQQLLSWHGGLYYWHWQLVVVGGV